MIISAIRFRKSDSSEFRTWKFHHVNNRKSNFLCMCEDEDTVRDIKNSLKFLFHSVVPETYLEVAIQISDDDGNSWIFERTPFRQKVLKNGRLQDNLRIIDVLSELLFDLDMSDSIEANTSTKDVIDEFDVFSKDCSLVSNKISTDKLQQSQLRVMSNKKVDELVQKCALLLDDNNFKNKHILSTLKERLEAIYLNKRELDSIKNNMLSDVKDTDVADLQHINRLTNEIELLTEIENLARPLLEPGLSPRAISENIVKIDQELSHGLKKCGLASLPSIDQPIPWSRLAATLCRLDIYEKLIMSSEKTRDFRENRLDPIYNDYLKTIEDVLLNNSKITSDLENCLNTLTTYLDSESKSYKPKKALSQILKDFIQPEPESSEDSSIKKSKLENSRVAVDFALSRLGELHMSLASGRKDYGDIQDKLEEAHECLVREYGKVKVQWSKLTKEHNIPEDISLENIINLVSRYTQLVELWHKRHAYKQDLANRQAKLERLEQIVMEWRRMTGSQKDAELTTQTILLSEVDGILRYKKKKEDQLNRLKDITDRTKALHMLKSYVDAQYKKITEQWNKVFVELSIPSVSIENKNWTQFFKLASAVDTWDNFVCDDFKLKVDLDIFDVNSVTKPVNLFNIDGEQALGIHLASIPKLVERSELQAFCVLFISDPTLLDMLLSVGTSVAKEVKKSILSLQNTTPRESLLTPKVQSVLEILNRSQSK